MNGEPETLPAEIVDTDISDGEAMGDQIVLRLRTARFQLDTARRVEAIVEIHAMAAAAKIYAIRRRLSASIVGMASEIERHALIKLGEALAETEKNPGSRGTLRGRDASGRTAKVLPEDGPPTLADLGISRNLASTAQRLAALTPSMQKAVVKGKVSIAVALTLEKKYQDATAVDGESVIIEAESEPATVSTHFQEPQRLNERDITPDNPPFHQQGAHEAARAHALRNLAREFVNADLAGGDPSSMLAGMDGAMVEELREAVPLMAKFFSELADAMMTECAP